MINQMEIISTFYRLVANWTVLTFFLIAIASYHDVQNKFEDLKNNKYTREGIANMVCYVYVGYGLLTILWFH